MKKLSKREKILLVILAFLVLIAGGVMLGVKPLKQVNSEKSAQLETLNEQAMTYQTLIASKDS